MKTPDNLFDMLREAVFGDPVKKQYERVEEAIKTKAQRVSDAEFNRTMANFYTDQVMATDPHVDWWDFAAAKQKQHDHQEACVKHERRTDEAHARVEAETQRLRTLQEKYRGRDA